MNALGLTLLGSIAHATVFASLAAILYLALRRASSAAGALAAGSSLLFMAVVSGIAISPWPVWYTIKAPSIVGPAPAPISVDASANLASGPEEGIARTDMASTPTGRLKSRQQTERAASSHSSVNTFLREFSRAVATPADAPQPARSSWPYWLAIGFLISVSLGFARLGLGLLAVGRLRSRSRPLNELALHEEVELLRSRAIMLAAGRGSRELGARNAGDSRLATTPHSLAVRLARLEPRRAAQCSRTSWRSVVRGDFLTGLIAQLSVALHFYHPVAHWLAKRLRLEQELAADAWARAFRWRPNLPDDTRPDGAQT